MTATTVDEAREREAFEAKVKAMYMHARFDRVMNGSYANSFIHGMWEGWLAAKQDTLPRWIPAEALQCAIGVFDSLATRIAIPHDATASREADAITAANQYIFAGMANDLRALLPCPQNMIARMGNPCRPECVPTPDDQNKGCPKPPGETP